MQVVHEHDRAGRGAGGAPRHVGGVAVAPVARVDVPQDLRHPLAAGLPRHPAVGHPVRRAHDAHPHPGQPAYEVTGAQQLASEPVVRQRGERRVAPGVVAQLVALLGDAPDQPGPTGGHHVPDHEERRPRPPGAQEVEQPAGVRTGPVVEGERDAPVAPAVGRRGGPAGLHGGQPPGQQAEVDDLRRTRHGHARGSRRAGPADQQHDQQRGQRPPAIPRPVHPLTVGYRTGVR